jgi:hypothetical protein
MCQVEACAVWTSCVFSHLAHLKLFCTYVMHICCFAPVPLKFMHILLKFVQDYDYQNRGSLLAALAKRLQEQASASCPHLCKRSKHVHPMTKSCPHLRCEATQLMKLRKLKPPPKPAYCMGRALGCGTASNCVYLGFMSYSRVMKAPLLPIYVHAPSQLRNALALNLEQGNRKGIEHGACPT